jgi:hypothetical protein
MLEGNPMKTGRRFFLSGIIAACAGAGELLGSTQRHGGPGPPISQIPDASGARAGTETVQPPRADPKVQLKEDQKILRHDVDRLLQMVKELKTESDNTPETEVLSLSLVKKTEDIEKLARQIRDRIRAS